MKKALVTGGAGFIGSNLVEKLVEENVEVTVLDSLYLGSTENLQNVKEEIEFIEGSVLNEEKLETAIQGVDTVFHQAARSSSPMHKENPLKGARVNIEGFIKTVEKAIEKNVEKVVYASTSSMYGSVRPPHDEDMDVMPTNLYTASKMSREKYAEAYSYNHKIETTGLRYFSVYGPHEKSKGKYANVVTQFLWKMQKGEQPVIWGDGNQTRDFTYVKDIAEANIKAAERKEELDGEVVNVGTGNDVSFNQVVEHLNKELGTNIEPEHVENPREKYVEKTKADTSKADEKLEYVPDTQFQEGVKKLVKHYQNKKQGE